MGGGGNSSFSIAGGMGGVEITGPFLWVLDFVYFLGLNPLVGKMLLGEVVRGNIQ